SLTDICKLPPPRSVGICTIEIEGYYYDPATLDCQMYSIGACHMTRGQSFGSQEDCVNKCIRGQRRSPDFYRNV
ncbi:CG31777, partial [Drosophila busckii]